MARPKRKIVADQLSNDELTPFAKPRPRKKQAVTKTKNAAVKALIRKNAATSPLLLLPSEVRENILIHLLGGNLIHLKYLDSSDLWDAEDQYSRISTTDGDESEQSSSHAVVGLSENADEHHIIGHLATASGMMHSKISPPTFRHAICVAAQSEQSAYDAFISGDKDVPEDESPEHYVAPCKERHVACKMCGNGPMYLLEEDRPALRVNLNVLGVCRQLYEEGNHLLWATNTFSFEDPRTFGKFFGSLNTAQKRKLTRIHITTDLSGLSAYYSTAQQRTRYDPNYWGKWLKIAYLNMLRGVHTVHLCLNQTFEYIPRGYSSADRMNGSAQESAQEKDVEVLLRLRTLSTRQVTVIVSDDPRKLERLGSSDLRWTAAKKAEYAESLRARLVDPNGAELVKADAEAANLARKVEIRDRAAETLGTYKSTLKRRRADMFRTARLASRLKAKADLAVEELAQTSSKSGKKASKLQEAADIRLEFALEARDAADYKTRLEKHWQGKVADARKRLERAMTQLGVTPEGVEYEEELEKLMESSSDSEMDVESEDTDDEFEKLIESSIGSEMDIKSEDTDDEFFSW